MFVDEFLKFTSNTLPSHTNNIYIGDFNLHLSDEADTDSAIFRDATEAMDLYQQCGIPNSSIRKHTGLSF